MAGYGEPEWANPSTGASNVPDVTPAAFTTPDTSAPTQDVGMTPAQARAEKSSCVQIGLSLFNVIICGLMIFLGVMGILAITFGANFSELTELITIIYMFVFSALLLAYEMMWWKSIPSINKLLRKNFGFMYGLRGKAAYMIFVAFLCLGVDSIDGLVVLMYIVGSLWLVSGVLHVFVSFWRPHLVENYQAPTAGWTESV